jgi:hypothetical protein
MTFVIKLSLSYTEEWANHSKFKAIIEILGFFKKTIDITVQSGLDRCLAAKANAVLI